MRFLFVDRILQLDPGKMIRGIKHVTQDDYYLDEDVQGRCCLISSLIGETLGQLAAWNVMVTNNFISRPVAGVVGSAKLFRPAYVGETILLESHIDKLDEVAVQYHSIARVNHEVVFTIEGALGPLLPMDMFISDDQIRRQFNEINRPLAEYIEIIPADIQSSSKTKKDFIPLSFRFDHIMDYQPGHSLTATKQVTRAASYFPDHFPHKPVLPLTVLLECKINLAREFLVRENLYERYEYQTSELRRIKMNEFIYPGDVVICHMKIKQHDEERIVLSYRSEVAGKRVCVLDVVMKAKIQ